MASVDPDYETYYRNDSAGQGNLHGRSTPSRAQKRPPKTPLQSSRGRPSGLSSKSSSYLSSKSSSYLSSKSSSYSVADSPYFYQDADTPATEISVDLNEERKQSQIQDSPSPSERKQENLFYPKVSNLNYKLSQISDSKLSNSTSSTNRGNALGFEDLHLSDAQTTGRPLKRPKRTLSSSHASLAAEPSGTSSRERAFLNRGYSKYDTQTPINPPTKWFLGLALFLGNILLAFLIKLEVPIPFPLMAIGLAMYNCFLNKELIIPRDWSETWKSAALVDFIMPWTLTRPWSFFPRSLVEFCSRLWSSIQTENGIGTSRDSKILIEMEQVPAKNQLLIVEREIIKNEEPEKNYEIAAGMDLSKEEDFSEDREPDNDEEILEEESTDYGGPDDDEEPAELLEEANITESATDRDLVRDRELAQPCFPEEAPNLERIPESRQYINPCDSHLEHRVSVQQLPSGTIVQKDNLGHLIPISQDSSEEGLAYIFLKHFRIFSPWTLLSQEIDEVIFNQLKKPLSRTDLPRGSIYIYWNGPYEGIYKIGRTVKKERRKDDEDDETEEQEEWKSLPSAPSPTRVKQWSHHCKVKTDSIWLEGIPHHGKVERMVHAELHYRRLIQVGCICDNAEHKEWFFVDVEHVKKVVKKWSNFMRKNPYMQLSGTDLEQYQQKYFQLKPGRGNRTRSPKNSGPLWVLKPEYMENRDVCIPIPGLPPLPYIS